MVLQQRAAAGRLKHEANTYARAEDLSYEGLAAFLPKNIPELDDAWSKLTLIPPQAIEPLEQVRYLVRLSLQSVERIPVGREASPSTDESKEQARQLRAGMTELLQENYKKIADACEKLDQPLENEISRLYSKITPVKK